VTFFVCVVSVWQQNFEPVVCVPGTRHTHRRFRITLPNTDYAHEKCHE